MACRLKEKVKKALDFGKGKCNNYYTMTEGERTMTAALRQAITESGLPLQRIEKLTGVKRQSIAKFIQGEQSLRLDLADKLAAHFGIECRRTRRKGR